MPNQYSEKELTELFFVALDCFKECLETDICRENVCLAFFTLANGMEVYEQFCKAHFPKYLSEPYWKEGYFDDIGAQAFLNEEEYGVLIRRDLDFNRDEMFGMFLHEISHLFCTRNETENGDFFDRYCMGTGGEDGIMNAGYAIWREAVADIMADFVISEYAEKSLKDNSVVDEICRYYNEISPASPYSKRAMSLIIANVMISEQVAGTESWPKAAAAIKENIPIDDEMLIQVFEQVFRQLHTPPFWKITPTFIMDLGVGYLALLTHKHLKDLAAGSLQD